MNTNSSIAVAAGVRDLAINLLASLAISYCISTFPVGRL